MPRVQRIRTRSRNSKPPFVASTISEAVFFVFVFGSFETEGFVMDFRFVFFFDVRSAFLRSTSLRIFPIFGNVI